jgi:hypothetical protein
MKHHPEEVPVLVLQQVVHLRGLHALEVEGIAAERLQVAPLERIDVDLEAVARDAVGERRLELGRRDEVLGALRRHDARDHHARDRLRRVGERHVQHAAPPPVVRRDVPHARAAEIAECHRRAPEPAGRRLVEVEDVVLARVAAGRRRGPGGRRQRRQRRAQRRTHALAQEPCDRRQQPGLGPWPDQVEGGGVEAHHEHPPTLAHAARRSLAASRSL